VKTADQVKHELHINGSSLRKWAEENGYPYRTVSDVVRGINKGSFGMGYEISLKLGLKREKTAA
jgi:gp16 family phage-associated protein